MSKTAIAIIVGILASNASAQTILLPDDGQRIVGSGNFVGEGTEHSGAFSSGYFGVLNQSADRALMFDVGLSMDWSDGWNRTSGTLYAGIIHRSMLGNGAVLGFNAYVDAGLLNSEIAGLVSAGVEYHPALGGDVELLFAGNLYHAFEDYTDTGAFGAAATIPRSGADAFVTVDYTLGDGLSLTGTGGIFGYVGTDFAQELIGARMDFGARYMLNPQTIISGSVGARVADGRDTELVASLGLQIALGGGSGGAMSTMSSSGIVDPPEERQAVIRAARPNGVLVAPPTRHFGYGTPFTPVESTGGGNTPQPTALLACQAIIIPGPEGTGTLAAQACSIDGNAGIPLGSSAQVSAGVPIEIVFPEFEAPSLTMGEVADFICVDGSNMNAAVAFSVTSTSPSNSSITLVAESGTDVLCTVSFRNVGI
ncbi:hypothetical protein [Jannaschia sp. CCS1]|uniref:hypothetical protein n=1 Tax=Jannaschia sp. (strain CCS1) TaxID=290400 RepID=UPI000053C7A9|nr:hypothetical protein [Jannaschia sp. CCS1]ABD57012.1 hypothetical protein Jann_4095 [Jannaschia sp. CCS1]